jgi:hypothetical protein
MRFTRLGSVLALLALSGCGAYSAPPVEVRGEPANLQTLAGSWHGTFRNPQMHQKGQIDFRMSADADSAFGEVTMYTQRPSVPIWTKPGTLPSGTTEAAPSWLRIRFVRVESGYVSGEMDPMYEPTCQCFVVAKFIGRIRGSVIEGSFTSRSGDQRFESNGSWRVERTEDAKP